MERKEAMEKYGDVPCFFKSYYKYTFTFVGKAEDGTAVQFALGGCADDIYKTNIKAGDPYTVNATDCDGDLSFAITTEGAEPIVFQGENDW
jgi:hypothetical protein